MANTENYAAHNVPPLTTGKAASPPSPTTLLMIKMRTYAAQRNIDVRRILQDAGGKLTASGDGAISKVKFMTAILDGFHTMAFPKGGLEELAAAYGAGDADSRSGGHLEVAWLAFVRELMMLPPSSRPPTERS